MMKSIQKPNVGKQALMDKTFTTWSRTATTYCITGLLWTPLAYRRETLHFILSLSYQETKGKFPRGISNAG